MCFMPHAQEQKVLIVLYVVLNRVCGWSVSASSNMNVSSIVSVSKIVGSIKSQVRVFY